MSLQGIEDALVKVGDSSIKTSTAMDSLNKLTNETSVSSQRFFTEIGGTLAQVNLFLDKVQPTLDDVYSLEQEVHSIVRLLFVILILIAVVIGVSVVFWFFRHLWPVIVGRHPKPKNFSDYVYVFTTQPVASGRVVDPLEREETGQASGARTFSQFRHEMKKQ